MRRRVIVVDGPLALRMRRLQADAIEKPARGQGASLGQGNQPPAEGFSNVPSGFTQ